MAEYLSAWGSVEEACSEPRTPSPRSDSAYSPPSVDMLTPSEFGAPPPSLYFQPAASTWDHQPPAASFWPSSSVLSTAAVPLPAARGFLADLNDYHQVDEIKDHHHHQKHAIQDGQGMYLSPPGGIFRADWDLGGSVGGSSAESSPSVHNLAPPTSGPPPHTTAPQDSYSSYQRRASYPYVRHDDTVYQSSPRNDGAIYAEPMPMDHHHHPQPLAADPAHLHARPLDDASTGSQPQYGVAGPHSHHHQHNPHQHPHPHSHPHHQPDDAVKMEPASSGMVPAHSYYRPAPPQQQPQHAGPPPPQAMPAAPGSYMTGGIPIMHTDDAASKETQYLRRRCFNCHTTEPPSWRRSTLNPGKIVCNKCGLYERTHLRPRPHRFDELRATSKARKAASKALGPPQQMAPPQQPIQQHHLMQQPQPQQLGPQQPQQQQHVPSPSMSPKSQHAAYVKKEPVDEHEIRRASVGSVGSSSMNGAQEWDQNVPRLSHSPPSSHTASPIRLPSLPVAPVGSRTPDPQRPYYERRTSMPMTVESGSSGVQRDEEAQPPLQWQQGSMTVAELVEDDNSRNTPN